MRNTLILFISLLPLLSFGQSTISFKNPSFEDTRKCCSPPVNWTNCEYEYLSGQNSPVDVQPGSFNVTLAPQEGFSYLGMVVRDDDSKEQVSQKLSKPLRPNVEHHFALYAFCSDILRSMSLVKKADANYSEPTYLQIWGGMDICEKRTLLYTSPRIENRDWERYNVIFTPDKAYSHLFFEATFKPEGIKYKPFCGNLMLDNLSKIIFKRDSVEDNNVLFTKEMYKNATNNAAIFKCTNPQEVKSISTINITDLWGNDVFLKRNIMIKEDTEIWNTSKLEVGYYLYECDYYDDKNILKTAQGYFEVKE